MISHYHYDTKVFPFIIPVQEMIGEIDFTTIHERMDIVLLDREKDQSTELHKRFYSHFHDKTPEWEEFMKIYIPFVGPICEELGYENPLYQTIPTFRVHAPGGKAVGEWHVDSEYNHSKHEWNVFLPFTDAYDTSTIFVEYPDDNITNLEAEYGEYYLWKGSVIKHGNVQNTTGNTRISLDFRVVDESELDTKGKRSINDVTEMEVGGYWTSLN